MNLSLKQPILIFLLMSTLFPSCIKMALRKAGVFEKSVTVKYISNEKKQLIFIPMHHVGTKEFYDDVRFKTDSLLKENYIVFFEAVKRNGITDSLQKDTLYRKVRKLTGVDFITVMNNGGYIDTVKNTILGMKLKYIETYKLMNQSRNLLSGLDSFKVKNVDASIIELVSVTEKKYAPIILKPYDFETAFGEKYKPQKNNEMKDYFVTGYRNKLLTDSILKNPHDKIAIVYGAKHFDGILKNLQQADLTYKEVKKL